MLHSDKTVFSPAACPRITALVNNAEIFCEKIHYVTHEF